MQQKLNCIAKICYIQYVFILNVPLYKTNGMNPYLIVVLATATTDEILCFCSEDSFIIEIYLFIIF